MPEKLIENPTRKPTKSGIVTPEPYFKIVFGCTNRASFEVKSDLYIIADKIGIEIQDGYITEKCDYEGDLEEIIVYNDERGNFFVISILSFYGISVLDVPDGMNIVLSIF